MSGGTIIKLGVVTGLFTSSLACKGLQQIDPESPCNEIGYAISSRVFDCTGDDEAANAAYERFDEQIECIPVWISPVDRQDNAWIPDSYHCAYAIRSLSCGQVAAYGKNIDPYLGVSPTCGMVAQHADGSPIVWQGYDDPSIACSPVEEGPPVNVQIKRLNRHDPFEVFIKDGEPCIERSLGEFAFDITVPQGSSITVRDDHGVLLYAFPANAPISLVIP